MIFKNLKIKRLIKKFNILSPALDAGFYYFFVALRNGGQDNNSLPPFRCGTDMYGIIKKIRD